MPIPLQTPVLPSEVLIIAETQWLFTEEELLRTPSIIAGLPLETERENRSKGVNFILQVGIMLKLPQITLATASVFLHRFYTRHPMKWPESPHGFHHYEVGATSLFLATKVEENCRKMKELVIACCRVAQKDPYKLVDEQDKEYWRWRDVILVNEDVMLEALCFDLNLEPPYRTLFEQLVFFREGDNSMLRNAAWAFVNDSYLTTVCLLFPSRIIAASALYAAAKHCRVTFPDDVRGRPWWESTGVALGEIRKTCNYMASVYEGAPLKASRNGGIYERMSDNEDIENEMTRCSRPIQDSSRTPEDGNADGSTVSPNVGGGSEVTEARIRPNSGIKPLQDPTVNGIKRNGNGDSSLQDDHSSYREGQRIDGAHISDGGNPVQTVDKISDAPELDGSNLLEPEISSHCHLKSPELNEVSEEGEVEA